MVRGVLAFVLSMSTMIVGFEIKWLAGMPTLGAVLFWAGLVGVLGVVWFWDVSPDGKP